MKKTLKLTKKKKPTIKLTPKKTEVKTKSKSNGPRWRYYA